MIVGPLELAIAAVHHYSVIHAQHLVLDLYLVHTTTVMSLGQNVSGTYNHCDVTRSKRICLYVLGILPNTLLMGYMPPAWSNQISVLILL